MIINSLLRNPITSSLINRGMKVYRLASVKLVDFKYEDSKNPSLTKEELIHYNKHRKLGAKKNLCMAPSTSMFFSFSGEVLMCSQNRVDILGNVNKNTLSEIWFNEIRYNLDEKINKNYNLKEGCYRCELSIKSKDYNSLYSQNNDFHIGKAAKYPKRMGFELHNFCNLECIMCNGEFSSAIRVNREKRKPLPFVYSDEFLNQLDEFLPHLKYADIVGGEPTLITYYYKIIDKILQLNPKCLIHIQTNATVLKDKFKEQLKKGNFEIGLSIDSLDEKIFVSIRKNLVWKDFKSNLDYYIEESKANRIKLTVNFCPMPINSTQIIPVIEFCNKHKLPLYFCMVESPFICSYLSTSALFIEKVIKEISNNNLPSSTYYESNNKNQLLSFIELLKHWKIRIELRESKSKLILDKTISEIKNEYEQFISERIPATENVNLKEELKSFTYSTIEAYEESLQKEILVFLLVTFDAPIYQIGDNNLLTKFKYDIKEYIDFITNKSPVSTI